MNGERAVRLLGSLLAGDRGDAEDKEIDLLVEQGLLAEADSARLARARVYGALVSRHRLGSLEHAQAALVSLEARLRSPWRRMFSFAETLRREERDRAQLRGLVGAMRDHEEWPRIGLAREALVSVAAKTPWVLQGDGASSVAVTLFGWRAAAALQLRLDRFGPADLRAFMKSFRKSDAGMRKLGEDYQLLSARLRSKVPKGLENVVTGLLKSGLPPEQALQRYGQAKRQVQSGRLPVEVPHAATALVRASAREADAVAANRRLETALSALRLVGLPDGPVLRGAAKALVDAPDQARAARRFRSLYDGLSHAHFEVRLRLTARLYPSAGSVSEVLTRMHTAAARYPSDAAVAAALAATATDSETLALAIARHEAIVSQLVARNAFPRTSAVPASAADLVSVPGTPEQVVEIVQQLVAYLPGRESSAAWGTSSDWAAAVAFARRFAY